MWVQGIADDSRWRYLAWFALGLSLAGGSAVIALLSGRFAYEASVLHSPVYGFVATLCMLGLAYLALLWLVPRTPSSRALIVWVLLVGTLMRAVMSFSTPILEDDYYRYLWEGAVVANGLSPFEHPPISHDGVDAPAALVLLGQDAGMTVERVNHPHLTTIYPPLAQAAFAVSYWIKPFSLDAWRFVVFASEAASVVLLLLLLSQLGRSPLWAAVYWWNPLVVKELANSAHMDALLVPPLLVTLMLCLRGHRTAASVSLACAAAVKLWPALLLPLVVYDARRPLWQALLRAALFVVLCAVLTYPLWSGALAPGSGLTAYGRSWEINDAAFMALSTVIAAVNDMLGLAGTNTGLLTRGAVTGFLGLMAVWLARSRDMHPTAVCARFMWLTAALFLLAPAQFPWYFAWLMPFLAIVPRLSLLLLTALLPLYYLRFYFLESGSPDVFDLSIVWFEYVPVWALLVFAWWRQRVRPGPSTPWVPHGAS